MTGRLQKVVAPLLESARRLWATDKGDATGAVSADVTKKSRSNFYYAFLFMPPTRRRAIYNVYAYCRLIDDIVDGSGSVAEKTAALNFWREELQRAFFDGKPEDPIGQGLAEARELFGLRHEDALAVLKGCEMDLHQTRYATWEELETYCYHVASAVGLLCIALFGCREARSRDYAIHLGLALQLTNILRDVGEDAARDRIYLPLSVLAEFGVSEADILSGTQTPAVAKLLRFCANRARVEYVRAQEAMTRADRRALLPAEIMGQIYFGILKEVERHGGAVVQPGPRISLSTERKVALAMSAVGQTLLPFGLARFLRQASV